MEQTIILKNQHYCFGMFNLLFIKFDMLNPKFDMLNVKFAMELEFPILLNNLLCCLEIQFT